MRKLIEIHKESLIVCDNTECDYTIPYTVEAEKYIESYIGKECPECGENLLTREDYLQHARLMKSVDWINKWFSWVTIFYSKKQLENPSSVSVHVHNGIKIENEK